MHQTEVRWLFSGPTKPAGDSLQEGWETRCLKHLHLYLLVVRIVLS